MLVGHKGESTSEMLKRLLPGETTTDDIDYDLENPCDDCPFTRSGDPNHKGVLSDLPLYDAAIREGSLAHACHKTDSRTGVDHGLKNRPSGRPKHCAGLLQLYANADIPVGPAFAIFIRRAGDVEALIKKAKANPKSFNSMLDMLNHYHKEVEDV